VKRRRKPLDPRLKLVLAVVVPLVVLAAGWTMVVKPERSKASDLVAQVQSVQQQILANKAAATAAGRPEPIRVADIFRLATAMPDSSDMPGIILQLNQIAQETGIQLTTFQPDNPPQSESGYQKVTIKVTLSGNFYALSDFLYRLRSLVAVRSGKLLAAGRMFSIEQIDFAEIPPTPEITATLTLDAYVYGGTAAAPSAAPSTASTNPAETTTTDTTTTDTTATAPAASATGVGGSTG